jgi:hypothetical protein
MGENRNQEFKTELGVTIQAWESLPLGVCVSQNLSLLPHSPPQEFH